MTPRKKAGGIAAGAASLAALAALLTQVQNVDDMVVSEKELAEKCISRLERMEAKYDVHVEHQNENLRWREEWRRGLEEKIEKVSSN